MILERVLGGAPFGLKATRSWRRSLAKTLTWRLFATADTFLISVLITGNLRWAGSIVGIEFLTKMAWYFLHERAWAYAHLGVAEGRSPMGRHRRPMAEAPRLPALAGNTKPARGNEARSWPGVVPVSAYQPNINHRQPILSE